MIRLYIPTSSLNADSILSCECISPVSLCRNRRFGYSHFETLDELRQFDDYTLAFTKIPRFSISDPLRENYPMVVEFEVMDIEKSGLVRVGEVDGTVIYATNRPIRISPSNSRLLFFNYNELDYTYHNCSDSAKCKLFDFFRGKNFASVTAAEKGEPIQTYLDAISVPSLQKSYSENAYDKAKGFVWGFGMGLLLSQSPEIAKLLKIQKRIYDIISSTKNDVYVIETFRKEIEELDKEYSDSDPTQRLAKKRWKEHIKELESIIPSLSNIDVDLLLRTLGVESDAKERFLKAQKLNLRKPIRACSIGQTLNYEQYYSELDAHTKAVIYQNNRDREDRLHLSEMLNVDTDKFETITLSSRDEDSLLFNEFIRRVLLDETIRSIEDLRINRSEVARNVVVTLKSIVESLGKEWKDSEIQAYFDRMRKNITKYEPFELEDLDDSVFKGIAAFILKGEDFDSLKVFLEINAVSDYRYSFALWGLMVGYVNIPRVIIENLFNKKSISILFNNAQKILHRNSPLPNLIGDTINSITSVTMPSIKTVHYTQSFRERVLAFFDKIKKGKKQQEQMRAELIRALDQLGDSENSFLFICTLNDFSKWKNTSKAWQEMQAEFCPNYYIQSNAQRVSEMTNQSRKKIINYTGDLFAGQREHDGNDSFQSTAVIHSKVGDILQDKVLSTIVYLKFPNIPKRVIEDIDWFVDNYKTSYIDAKKGELKGCYRNSSRNIHDVLTNLDRYLLRRMDQKEIWIRNIYQKLSIRKILDYIHEIYGDR